MSTTHTHTLTGNCHFPTRPLTSATFCVATASLHSNESLAMKMSLSPTLAVAFCLTPPEKTISARQPMKVFFQVT